VHSEMAPPLEEIHCRRILCAVNLTERSQSIVQWAARLAAEYEADIAIVHATAELPPAFAGWSLEEDFERSVAEEATTQIETLQKETGVAGRIFVNSGDPAEVVNRAGQDFDADLVVMGRHDGGGIAGVLLQNAYSILRDSPCPVISI
jgi:nucleotide-binding universal stress UspA family protein